MIAMIIFPEIGQKNLKLSVPGDLPFEMANFFSPFEMGIFFHWQIENFMPFQMENFFHMIKKLLSLC